MMESPLSISETQASIELSGLVMYGKDLIWSFSEILVTGIIYGAHMLLTLVAITILWCRKGGIKQAKAILGVSVIALFLLATADLCCTMVYLIVGVQSLLINNVGMSIVTKNIAYLEKFHILLEMHSVLFPVAFVIGDAIVIWRACALSGGKKRIIFLLVVLQLATTGQYSQQNQA
ncbi:hypothetical protein PM082_000040 [Marasmius tenuissimus]|nr:hypothetical protein PM082_000040 [Marasmius tenuissimus]